MPNFRVYYAERMPHGARDWMRTYGLHRVGSDAEEIRHREVEWEEEIEATDAPRALDSFFGEHATDRTQVMWVDDAGESHELRGIDDYDPEKTYIWIEDDKLMEYQGMDESTPGMATCPLCSGEGEVVAEVAEEFLANEEEEDEEEEEGWS
jgi:hypothetical protein